MLTLLLCAVLTCFGSLALGQGVLALCGARQWSWLAPSVGVAVMILIAVPAIHLPGRSATVAVAMAVCIAAGIALWVRYPAHRPPLFGLLAGLPVALLVLVPFAASGHAGTLGVSFDNDMGAHLLLAEAYRSAAVAHVSPLLPEYPLGPHALAAALAEGLGARIDLAFAGLTAATPILLAWTALASVRRVSWPGRALVATVVGIPFLIAAYYGQGSFKELLEALFAVSAALILADFQPELQWRRWIPLALISAGAVSVYSLQGLVWTGAFFVMWLVVRAALRTWNSGVGEAWDELRAELIPGVVGIVVLVVVLIPQIPRIEKFASNGAGYVIAKTNLGNLAGPLPGWEAFGVWSSPDYRFPPLSAFGAGMWTAFVLALVLVGAVVLARRGRWMLPMAAAVSMLVWVDAAHSQSPYVAAKTLVIASPLLLLVAALALVERGGFARASWWRIAAPLLAVVLLVRVVDSSWEALRASKVGPTNHLVELRSLRPLLGGQPTLFLGDDDFIQWELAGARVTPAYLAGMPEVPLRPEKAVGFGNSLDFDSVTSATLNDFDWVITTRDAAGSEAPAGMRLVRMTQDYELWQRVGEVAPFKILDEGSNAAATLNCTTAAGRAILRGGGIAAVRPPSLEVAVPPIAPGSSATVSLSLAAGSWDLETPYLSPLPLTVTATGLKATLPANLERPGPRWPIGQIVVTRSGPVAITFHVKKYWLTPMSDIATPVTLIATPVGGERTVPLRQACGKLVDWYRD
jgi:hypothetical protein